MSIHEDLFEDGAALVLEVQGRAALFSFWFDGIAEPLVIDGSQGAVKLDRVESDSGGVSDRRLLESCTIRAARRNGQGIVWNPQYTMKVGIGADPTKWTVREIRGVGTAIYSIDLVRSYEVNKQVAGREGRGR